METIKISGTGLFYCPKCKKVYYCKYDCDCGD